jgi:hypothetical protein
MIAECLCRIRWLPGSLAIQEEIMRLISLVCFLDYIGGLFAGTCCGQCYHITERTVQAAIGIAAFLLLLFTGGRCRAFLVTFAAGLLRNANMFDNGRRQRQSGQFRDISQQAKQ